MTIDSMESQMKRVNNKIFSYFLNHLAVISTFVPSFLGQIRLPTLDLLSYFTQIKPENFCAIVPSEMSKDGSQMKSSGSENLTGKKTGKLSVQVHNFIILPHLKL